MLILVVIIHPMKILCRRKSHNSSAIFYFIYFHSHLSILVAHAICDVLFNIITEMQLEIIFCARVFMIQQITITHSFGCEAELLVSHFNNSCFNVHQLPRINDEYKKKHKNFKYFHSLQEYNDLYSSSITNIFPQKSLVLVGQKCNNSIFFT